MQLSEQDQALPVNINYLVNITGGGREIGKKRTYTYKQRVSESLEAYFNAK